MQVQKIHLQDPRHNSSAPGLFRQRDKNCLGLAPGLRGKVRHGCSGEHLGRVGHLSSTNT
jgi:hypothetical protein